jgi:hypothetical protein
LAKEREPGARGESPSPLVLPAYPRWILGGCIAAITAVIVAVAVIVAPSHEESRSPEDTPAEQQIIAVFGLPNETKDDELIGDFLVRRIYGLELETGRRFEGFFQAGTADGETVSVLDVISEGLEQEESIFEQFVGSVAAPAESLGDYLGLRVLTDTTNRLINFDGSLPAAFSDFRGPDGQSLDDYLRYLSTQEPQRIIPIVSSDGTNYYPFDTRADAGIRRFFNIGDSVYVSHHIIVDTTSPEQRATLYELRRENPIATPD